MSSSEAVIVPLYFLATVVSGVVAAWLWLYRDRIGAKPLVLTFVGGAIWSAGPLLGTLTHSHLVMAALYRIQFIGIAASVFGLFVFALEFTGRERWLRPRIIALLLIEPVVVIVLAFLNPRNVIFEQLPPADATWGVGLEWGIAFWGHALYSFVLLGIAIVLVLDFLARARAVYRGQAFALLLGILCPYLASLAHLIGPFSFNTTPIGIAAAGIFLGYAIVRYRFGDIVPIARDRVFETIEDPVFIIDDTERIVDANPATAALIGHEPEVGEDLATAVDGVSGLLDGLRDCAANGGGTFEITYRGRVFAVDMVPIDDDRNRRAGWLVVAKDVTARKEREHELEQRNQQLDRFAGIVSHDLRNPLAVASSRLDLAQREHDSEHLEHVANAHERIETIVEETLSLARAGATLDETSSVDLGPAVERWWEGVDTADATLEVSVDRRIKADEERLQQVFENLFRNSIEHGGPTVTVRVGELHDGFYVADNGPGLPGDIDVFEAGNTTNQDGTGFGLSIAEEIVTAHGWRLTSTASAEGGARFEIRGVDSSS